MLKISPLRKRQFFGGIIGLILAIPLIYILTLDKTEDYLSIGPMNTGHKDLKCFACHADASGNLAQQIQSNISYTIGAREESVDFGTKDVTIDNCLQCHDRPNDRHPVYRFSEPRFKEAIEQINATTCITCHTEHKKERVSVATVNYCMNCHQTLEVENDPLDISHKDLILNKKWSTCIQCHDFHGNHKYKVPEKLADTIPIKKIKEYFKGGKDPFGTDKKYTALSLEEWLKSVNQ